MKVFTAGGAMHAETRAYRPDIDGLRAIAVLSVVGFHGGVPFLRGGFVGVDVFFVISGYLICSIIYTQLQGQTFAISKFYQRRFRRILPALGAVLLFVIAIGALIMSPMEARNLGNGVMATALSASNIYLAFHSSYFLKTAALNPLLMTWSLAVEEQFYVAFPLLMLLLRKRSRREILWTLGVLSALSLALSVALEFHWAKWNFYLPVTRAWELVAGTMLAVWQSGKLRGTNSKANWMTHFAGYAGLLLVLASTALYRPSTRFPGYEALPPVLGSVLILMADGSHVSKLLTFRPLTWAGLISYSLYLWHWPLLSFATVASSNVLQPKSVVLVLTIAVGMAIASYFFVELRFRFRRTRSRNRELIGYVASALLLAVLGGIYSFSGGLPGRCPAIARIEREADMDRKHPCMADSTMRRTPECLPGVASGKATLALLGDSHAEALYPLIRNLAAENGWQLVTITKGGCPPTTNLNFASLNGDADFSNCERFNETALSVILARSDIHQVILAGAWSGSYLPRGYLQLGLANEIAALEGSGKRVVLVQDVPGFPYDPVAAVRDRLLPVRHWVNKVSMSPPPEGGWDESEPAAVLVSGRKAEDIATLRGFSAHDGQVVLLDPTDVLCRQKRCYYADGNQLYYIDTSHLSRLGSQLLMRVFGAALQDYTAAAN